VKSFSETLAENELQQLKQENAALREELQQSEDRFRNIPDEVWSKADLVEMTNKALEERDDANKQNAALRQQLEDVQRVRDSIEDALADAYDEAEACWVNTARLADAAEEVLDSYILTKRVLTGHPCPQNMGICIDLRAAIDAARKEAQP